MLSDQLAENNEWLNEFNDNNPNKKSEFFVLIYHTLNPIQKHLDILIKGNQSIGIHWQVGPAVSWIFVVVVVVCVKPRRTFAVWFC